MCGGGGGDGGGLRTAKSLNVSSRYGNRLRINSEMIIEEG